jgi:AhpD family alkylhydroperoxidase
MKNRIGLKITGKWLKINDNRRKTIGNGRGRWDSAMMLPDPDRECPAVLAKEATMDNFYDRGNLKNVRKLRELKPDAYNKFIEFSQSIFKDDALPNKIKQLIAIGVAHTTQCPWCIDVHVNAAKDLGATDEEIAEAVLVAMEIRAGGAFTHSGIAFGLAAEHAQGHKH